ncbi:hypothetical protein, partial [Mediterraneibacter agrestimuris]|uniref:hypothetical protein n=1 Tax=Mediterraneibacter agrestimuris TaxID=2941333 RepID=UPI00203DB1B4
MQIGKRLFNFLREEQRKEMIQFLIGGMCLDFTEIQILNLYFCQTVDKVPANAGLFYTSSRFFGIIKIS